jgi:6-phosphogluconolactonase (cycloisomerase 2 family)
MANNKPFKIKNGLSAKVYLQSSSALGASDVDVSAGSYFSKTLTANTTLTFSNPPASGMGSSFALEITGAAVTVGYDIANAAYDSKTVSLSGSAQDMEAMFFKPDGLTFYALTRKNNDSVKQYSVTTAWDISTVNTTPVNSFTTSSQENAAQGLSFKADGTRMYVVGTNDVLYEYSLSTAWDISSASYNNVNKTLSTNGGPTDLFFKPDGTKFYVAEPNYVYEYSLSTAWNITTASLTTKSAAFSTKGGATSTTGVYLNGDGTALFTVSAGTDRVYQYPLSTPFAVSSLGSSTISFLFSSQFSGAGAMIFGNNATKMYLPLAGSGTVYQYSTAASAVATITYPSSVKWSGATAPDAPAAGEKDVYVFVTTNGGSNYYGIQAGDAVA